MIPPNPHVSRPRHARPLHTPLRVDSDEEEESIVEEDPLSSSKDDVTLASRFETRVWGQGYGSTAIQSPDSSPRSSGLNDPPCGERTAARAREVGI